MHVQIALRLPSVRCVDKDHPQRICSWIHLARDFGLSHHAVSAGGDLVPRGERGKENIETVPEMRLAPKDLAVVWIFTPKVAPVGTV